MTNLALFDLDNTLLSGDSDHSWGLFLVENKLVDSEVFYEKNEGFYQDYVAGHMDIYEYCQFAFEPLSKYSMKELIGFRKDFIETYILPLIDAKAEALVEKHLSQGDVCVIITATNSFITKPIADHFNISHLIATEPEIVNNQFTGQLSGTPCFQGGKITRLLAWLKSHKYTAEAFETIYGYSDSYNDLPLLEFATKPTAVNPDARLTAHAKAQNWPILHFMPTE